MDCREIIGKPAVGRMLMQGRLEPVGCGVPLGRKTSDGHSVAGDHDSLAVLDRVEQAGEVPRRMGRGDRYHDYRVSDCLRIYVWSVPLPSRRYDVVTDLVAANASPAPAINHRKTVDFTT